MTFDSIKPTFKIQIMKKIVCLVFVLISYWSFGQEEEKVRHHEIKANAFNLIVFKSVDLSYEYLIDSESSIGVSVLFNLQNQEDIDDDNGPYYNETFAITPYYRRYFSSRYAWGFFLEAFGMYNVQEDFDGYFFYDSINDVYINREVGETSNNFAIGMAVGGKFVSKKGFAFEVYGGVGRNLSQSNNDVGSEIVPRIGASLGYRF